MTDILERLKLELNDDEPKSFVEIDSQLIRDLAAEIRQLRLALNHQIEMRRQITGPLREEIAALRSRVGELEENRETAAQNLCKYIFEESKLCQTASGAGLLHAIKRCLEGGPSVYEGLDKLWQIADFFGEKAERD